jgi:hypothetical protein
MNILSATAILAELAALAPWKQAEKGMGHVYLINEFGGGFRAWPPARKHPGGYGGRRYE